jgi:predicted small secreted protein
MAEISQGEGGLFLVMNRFLALAVFAVVLLGCRGPGGPVERAGRGVDNAVYDVGTDIKRAGQKIQRAAE